MTMAGIEQAAEVASLLQDLTEQVESVAQMRRDPSIPAGALLSESEIDGAVHRELKQSSMVRVGKVPLPERFEAWDVYGRTSMLPTAQMSRMLSKPHAERTDVRAFHMHRAKEGVTRETCRICPPLVDGFTGTCQWCLERSGGRMQKHFDSQSAQEAHFRAFHEQEWQTLERQLDREMRQAELATQKELAQAMIAVATGRIPTVEVAAVAAPAINPTLVACPDCGHEVKPAGLAFHRRRWCKAGQ